ncbi:MAG: PEP-CTERM sorting domain-containing protein [Chromatiales bacterium]|nr:MAG: PEP-CTERM sorting domain-containing protein [Chromatiales bacterium]
MKKLTAWGALSVVVMLLGQLPAHANAVSFNPQLHLSSSSTFDPATSTVGTFATNVPFDVYVIADNFTDTTGLSGFEFSLGGVPAEFFLLSTVLPAGAVNFGSVYNFLVGLSAPIANTGPVVLATLTFLPIAPLNDVLLTLGPATPSSFGGSAPGYAAGNPENLIPFNFTSDLLLNQVSEPTPPGAPVPVPAAVWLFGSALGLLGWLRRKQA